MNRLLTCDLDLKRCHLYDATEEEVTIMDGTPADICWSTRVASVDTDVILAIEVASPQLYRKAHNSTMRWMVYNLIVAGQIERDLRNHTGVTVVVSPSNTWTKGYSESKRHLLAKATDEVGFNKEQNHNIKEMKAMAWMYRREPGLWTPMKEYLSCL